MKTINETKTQAFDRRFDAGKDISDQVDWSKGKRLHGGKRSGSGRRSNGRKAFTVRLLPETHQNIQRRAKKKGVSISQFIEELANH